MEIIKKHYKKLMDVASKVDFIKTYEKMKYMKLSRRDRVYEHGESMEVEKHIFFRVLQFKYLSTLLIKRR